eukprot:scaffold98973_cov75-Phaeocystis_antarctica.AAC.2
MGQSSAGTSKSWLRFIGECKAVCNADATKGRGLYTLGAGLWPFGYPKKPARRHPCGRVHVVRGIDGFRQPEYGSEGETNAVRSPCFQPVVR